MSRLGLTVGLLYRVSSLLLRTCCREKAFRAWRATCRGSLLLRAASVETHSHATATLLRYQPDHHVLLHLKHSYWKKNIQRCTLVLLPWETCTFCEVSKKMYCLLLFSIDALTQTPCKTHVLSHVSFPTFSAFTSLKLFYPGRKLRHSKGCKAWIHLTTKRALL